MNDELRMICHIKADGRDTEPFAGGGLLAVASGESGDATQRDAQEVLTTLCEKILPEYDPVQHAWLKNTYFDDWEQSKKPVGGKELAARVGLVRLLYGLLELPGYLENLDEQDARVSLTDFVKEGFRLCDETFYGDQDVQTAASLAVASVFCDPSEVCIDVLFAGNASAWVLSQNGLGCAGIEPCAPLSARDGATLNYCRVTHSLPCVVMLGTQGVAENLLPHVRLRLESMLLESLRHSDSMQAWQESMQTALQAVGDSDASLVLSAVGFSSFQQIQEYYSERAASVCALWNRVVALNLQKSLPPKGELARLKDVLCAQVDKSLASIAATLAHTYLQKIPDFMARDVGEPFLERYIGRERDAFMAKKNSSQQALAAIKEMICDAQNCDRVAGSILREVRQSGMDATMATAFDSLKSAAVALSAAKSAFDESCRRQSNLVAEEREVIGLLARRRTFIQKERDKNARERDENAEQQGELYHYQMVKMNEKVVWATKEQARLNEQYRQSCNPVNCRFCDPRCVHYAMRDDALSKEIRTRTTEKDNYVANYYGLRDAYARLKSEYAQLEFKDQVLEREDLELVRLMHAYESGHEVRAHEFSQGSARRFCERLVNQQRNRKQVTRKLEETEKALTEKELAYQGAVKAFFADEKQVELYAERLFQPELLKSFGYEGTGGEFVFVRNANTITNALKEEFLRDMALTRSEIIKSLTANFESHSVVDPCFDGATLLRFRILCRDAKDTPPNESQQLADDLDAYRSDHN